MVCYLISPARSLLIYVISLVELTTSVRACRAHAPGNLGIQVNLQILRLPRRSEDCLHGM